MSDHEKRARGVKKPRLTPRGERIARLLAPFATEILFLGAALLLLAPLLLRVLAGKPLIPGASSYVYLHGLGVQRGAYQLFLTSLSSLGEARILVSILLGLAAVYLFARLAERLFTHPHERTIALLVFMVNPLYLSVFTAMTPLTLLVPLALLAAVAAAEQKRSLLVIALPLTAAISPTTALATGVVIATLIKDRRPLLIAGAVALAAAALSAVVTPLVFLTSNPFVEFGDINGLSLVLAGLATMEGVAAWTERKGRGVFLLFLGSLALAPFEGGFLIVAGFGSAMLAGAFVARLARRRWTLKDAQPLTLVLVACLFLFLLLTHVISIVHEQPTSQLVTTLAALPPTRSVVLSPPSISPFVEALADHPAVPREHECDAGSERCAEIERLYHTWHLDDASLILQRYNITYLLITQEMRDGAVWNRDEEGLLFLLDHSERFKRIAADPEEELWKYTPPVERTTAQGVTSEQSGVRP